MIQTSYRDDSTNTTIQLTPHDEKYWQGAYRFEAFPLTVFKAGMGKDYTNLQTKIVGSERELSELRDRDPGWKDTPDEARAYVDACEADMARAAAEHNAAVTTMSEKAQAEALAYDRSTDELVADVPAPKRGPGRPRKVTEN